ncbi:MAG: hypothetical protein OSB51_09690, partial [Dokdonia donghaensis]|nr:hypothetical protein [Dokdonia donghaensis]
TLITSPILRPSFTCGFTCSSSDIVIPYFLAIPYLVSFAITLCVVCSSAAVVDSGSDTTDSVTISGL